MQLGEADEEAGEEEGQEGAAVVQGLSPCCYCHSRHVLGVCNKKALQRRPWRAVVALFCWGTFLGDYLLTLLMQG